MLELDRQEIIKTNIDEFITKKNKPLNKETASSITYNKLMINQSKLQSSDLLMLDMSEINKYKRYVTTLKLELANITSTHYDDELKIVNAILRFKTGKITELKLESILNKHNSLNDSIKNNMDKLDPILETEKYAM